MALERKVWCKYANWEEVATAENLDYVRQRITGLPAGQWEVNAMPAGFEQALTKVKEQCVSRRGHSGHVMDFGCGLGRNADFLRVHFDRAVGIDLPDMIGKLRQLPAAGTYHALYDDLDKLAAAEDIDILYDSVVLQHVVDAEFNAGLVAKFLALPNLRYVISLCNSMQYGEAKRGWPVALYEFSKLGWKEEYSVFDRETFRRPHHLRILVRPE